MSKNKLKQHEELNLTYHKITYWLNLFYTLILGILMGFSICEKRYFLAIFNFISIILINHIDSTIIFRNE